MILKKNFSPVKVVSYVKTEIFLAFIVSSCVYWLYQSGVHQLFLPFSIATILGSALAIFIAFRNNTSYSRWWEARSQWSNILNASRVCTRLVITFTDSHKSSQKYSQERSELFKKNMVQLINAWVMTMKNALRCTSDTSTFSSDISHELSTRLETANNKQNLIMLEMGHKVYDAMNGGVLAGFDSFQIENQLLVLQNSQGALERIKSTPLLRQYHYFTKVFLFVFIVLLPFSLMLDVAKNGYGYMVIPVSVLLSFVFAIIAKVGEVNEDPFENKITDVPMDYITNTIERDTLEMLGHENLPEKIKPQNGYLQ